MRINQAEGQTGFVGYFFEYPLLGGLAWGFEFLVLVEVDWETTPKIQITNPNQYWGGLLHIEHNLKTHLIFLSTPHVDQGQTE